MLECKDLVFSYDKKTNVLSGITLKFEPGRFYGIFGPNGSGKSTLLKVLTRELRPVSGTLSPQWKNPLERSRQIALVEQQIPGNLPLTVAETVALGRYPWENSCSASAPAVSRVLAMLDLEKLACRSCNSLSGGEKQRVMLARALAQETPVLCLDEPGSSLDIGYQHTLCRILKELAGDGKCVIMISHDLFSAPAYLDEMILLEKGSVVFKGAPEMLKKERVLERIFNIPPNSGADFF